MRNIELRICYTGTEYSGWQIQPHRPTVQGELQALLRKILKSPDLKIVGSSRTDAGVHAHDQHVSFKTECPVPLAGLKRALNHVLPSGIRVLEVIERELDYSARFHARAKHYGYFIFNGSMASPFGSRYAWEYGRSLDTDAMDLASHCFVGTHCFRAFQARGDFRDATRTTIYNTRVGRCGQVIYFDIVGRHFLYHMVRNILGALVKVGSGDWSLDELRARFVSGERSRLWVTAPARGLHLFKVYFEEPPYDFCRGSERFRQQLSQILAGSLQPGSDILVAGSNHSTASLARLSASGEES